MQSQKVLPGWVDPASLLRMLALPTVRDCDTKAALLLHIKEVHEGVRAFVRAIPLPLLNAPAYPDGWTAARNVQHSTKTTNMVSVWVALPRWLLKLFGRPKNPKARVANLRPTNRPNMTDYGRYEPADAATESDVERLIALLDAAEKKVCRAVEKRSEEELENLSGMFGGTNLRLFVLFGMRHMTHHVGVARSRLEASA